MSYLAALGQVGDAQTARANAAVLEEERMRKLAALRAQDAEAVVKRQRTEADYQAGRATDLGLPGMPTGANAWPTPQGGMKLPGAGVAPAVAAPPATGRARGVYTTPAEPTENQSDAESRRLARAGKIPDTLDVRRRLLGEPTGLGLNPQVPEVQRYRQLKELNQPAASTQSTAETARLDRSGEPGRLAAPGVVTPQLLAIVRQVESNNNPAAVSPKGAMGVMQTMPGTLRDPGFGVAAARDNSPAEMQRVGEDYLRAMVNRYGDLPTALVAYNWGPGNADRWRAQGSDFNRLPAETQGYLQKILTAMGNIVPSAQAAQSQPQQVAPQAPGLPTQQAAPMALDRSGLGGGTGFDDRDLQYQRMLLADLSRRLQTAPDAASQQAIITQARQIQGNIMHGELQGVSQRAQAGDPQAVDQLAQMAQVQYASTPQGLVSVTVDPYTGQGRAASQPMDVPTFSRMLFQRASSRIQQAMIQAMPEQAKQAAQMQREVAVEGIKGQNKLLEIEAQAERDIQQKLIEFNMQGENYQVSRDPMGTGAVLVTTRRGVFEYIPAKVVNGVQMESELKPVQR